MSWGRWPWIDEDSLRVLYLHEHRTQAQLARHFDCSPSCIVLHMRHYGIAARAKRRRAA